MSNREHRWIRVLVWCVIATIPVWLTIGIAKMWPYNDVSFPQGNVGKVEPGKVREGGKVFVTFPEYCNTGQVVTFRRWADLYVGGVRVASDEVSAITFYPQPGRPDCVENETQEIPLSDQFRAYGDRPTMYRIRFEAVYGPNPLRVVTVPSTTELFTVLPATSAPIG